MIRIATRGSKLALIQAGMVAELLGGAELVAVGPDAGVCDNSRFVGGVEAALRRGEAEIGVHSAKDLPGEVDEDLVIAAVPPREDPRDVWIGPGASLDEVPEGLRVGTASLRRQAELLAMRPDLEVAPLHGNVDTRLAKLASGEFDAIILAAAGLNRLGRAAEIGFALPAATAIPAAGQGALVLQTRADDADSTAAAAAIDDHKAHTELRAERAAVVALGATCTSPVGVHARLERREGLLVAAFIGRADGTEWLRDNVSGDPGDPEEAGRRLATRLLGAGAAAYLDAPAAGPGGAAE